MRISSVFACFLVFLFLGSCTKNDSSNTTTPVNTTPTVRSFAPTSGGYNTQVTISGKNLGSNAANTGITVNGIPASVQTWNDTSIVFRVPELAGTGNISVTTTKGQLTPGTFTYVPSVFVSGFERNGTFNQAKYWKDGAAFTVGDSAVANCILVKGADIYLAGPKGTSSGRDIAVFWKNGIQTSLNTNSLTGASVLSLFLSASDLYAAGTAIDNSTSSNQAIFWKNGSPTILSGGTPSQAAYSIATSGNDIYVATSTWGSSNRGQLFKNSTLQTMTMSNLNNSNFAAVFVNGTDVYVAGSEFNGTRFVAKYWKNGIPVSLTNGTNDAFGKAITVVGNDVYVAGHESNGTNSIAKYWKNGVAVNLTSGTTDATATGIQVFGNDVYVSGTENAGITGAARYWKNTTKINLTDGSRNAQATGIVIQ